MKTDLTDIGPNLHGRVIALGDGTKTIEIHSGGDPLQALDDMDFMNRPISTAVRSYVAHETAIQPQLVLITWTQAAALPACAQATVVGHGFLVEDLVVFADGIRP